MDIIRVVPVEGELFAGTLLRMAAINLTSIRQLLGKTSPLINTVPPIRDFGVGIDQYCAFFEQSQMLRNRVLQHGTIAHYYLGSDVTTKLIPQRWSSGSLCSRYRPGDYLRVCPICLHKDIAEIGVGTWRTAHQYPLTEVCLQHGVPLAMVFMRKNLRLPTSLEGRTQAVNGCVLEKLTTIAIAESAVIDQIRNDEYASSVRRTLSTVIDFQIWDNIEPVENAIRSFLKSLRGIGVYSSLYTPLYLRESIESLLINETAFADPMLVTLINASLSIDAMKIN